MPFKLSRPALAVASLAAVAVLAACGGSDAVTDAPSATSPADFETCSGFLDVAQVASAAGRDDVTVADLNPNSGTAAGLIIGLCVMEYVTPPIDGGSGPALTLLVLSFATEGDADSHHRRVAGEIRSMREAVNPDAELSEDVLGSASYAVTLNEQGVGSVLGFREGGFVVQFNSTVPTDGEPLVSQDAMVPLARQVLANLTGG